MKSQVDMYKKQVQELQSRLSEETKRADKAEFENKRALEKLGSIQQEKDVKSFVIYSIHKIEYFKNHLVSLNKEFMISNFTI